MFFENFYKMRGSHKLFTHISNFKFGVDARYKGGGSSHINTTKVDIPYEKIEGKASFVIDRFQYIQLKVKLYWLKALDAIFGHLFRRTPRLLCCLKREGVIFNDFLKTV